MTSRAKRSRGQELPAAASGGTRGDGQADYGYGGVVGGRRVLRARQGGAPGQGEKVLTEIA